MTQKIISDMIRETVGNTSEFFNKIAEHIEHLENTISQLQEKIAEYENLSDEEIDDHK